MVWDIIKFDCQYYQFSRRPIDIDQEMPYKKPDKFTQLTLLDLFKTQDVCLTIAGSRFVFIVYKQFLKFSQLLQLWPINGLFLWRETVFFAPMQWASYRNSQALYFNFLYFFSILFVHLDYGTFKFVFHQLSDVFKRLVNRVSIELSLWKARTKIQT